MPERPLHGDDVAVGGDQSGGEECRRSWSRNGGTSAWVIVARHRCPAVIEGIITHAISEADRSEVGPDEVIRDRLAELAALPGGHDFARVIT